MTSPDTTAIVDVERLEVAALDAHKTLMTAVRERPELADLVAAYQRAELAAYEARRALRAAEWAVRS
jgi:hypothetical protein